ncbi:MAG: DUF2294 domain-containing protein [Bacillota bacterium]
MPQGKLAKGITDQMIQWCQNYLGQNITEVKTDIIRDMIIVSVKGEIPSSEQHLSREKEGMLLVKDVRRQLIECGLESLDNTFFNLTGSRRVSLHTDVSTKTGERIFVFKMDRALE